MKNDNSGIAFPLIIISIAVLIAVLFLGVGIGRESPEISEPVANVIVQSPQEPENLVQDEWEYRSAGECGVKFNIPPKVEPYYKPYDPNRQPSTTEDADSGRFWDFPRGGINPNLLSRFPNTYELRKQANTMFASEQEASGYISSAVSVSCIPNKDKLNNSTMLNSLETHIQEYNEDTDFKGMEADTYTIISTSEKIRWEHSVIDLTVSKYYKNPGGEPTENSFESTMFTTPEYIYEVIIVGETEDSFVRETANQIFESLIFE